MMETDIDQGVFFSSLFKNDLYLINDQDPAVVVFSPASNLSDVDLELISKIMSAKGVAFDTDDIHYIVENFSTEVDAIAKHAKGFVLVFEGEKTGTSGFKNFEINRKNGPVPIIQSCSLKDLAEDGDKKKLLWRVLQQL